MTIVHQDMIMIVLAKLVAAYIKQTSYANPLNFFSWFLYKVEQPHEINFRRHGTLKDEKHGKYFMMIERREQR